MEMLRNILVALILVVMYVGFLTGVTACTIWALNVGFEMFNTEYYIEHTWRHYVAVIVILTVLDSLFRGRK